MKKIILILFLSVLQLTIINALGPVGENGIDIVIQNDTISVRGYTIVGVPVQQANGQMILLPQKFVSQTNALFVNSITESITSNFTCAQFNYTQGNNTIIIPTNCSYNVNYIKELPFVSMYLNTTNQSQPTVVDSTTLGKLEQCLMEKAQYKTSYDNCLDSKNRMNNYEQNYTTCKDQTNSCENQLTTLQSQVGTMTKEKEDKKNTPYLFGVGGLLIGAGAVYYFTKSRTNFRNPDSNYNRNQAG